MEMMGKLKIIMSYRIIMFLIDCDWLIQRKVNKQLVFSLSYTTRIVVDCLPVDHFYWLDSFFFHAWELGQVVHKFDVDVYKLYTKKLEITMYVVNLGYFKYALLITDFAILLSNHRP